MSTSAIYAGSFDPPTVGHEDIIKSSAKEFKKLLILIAVNPDKKSYFTPEERLRFLQRFIERENLANVAVEILEGVYVASYARAEGYKILIRGVRDHIDEAYERKIEWVNSKIYPDIVTKMISPKEEYKHISSSLVKSLVGHTGWTTLVSQMVSKDVYSAFLKAAYRPTLEKFYMSWRNDRKGLEDLVALHSEPQRFYHTTEHLYRLILAYQDIGKVSKRWQPLEESGVYPAAIFFHDAIYNPLSKTNEEDSAELWMKVAGVSQFPHWYAERVKKAILATKEHKPTGDYAIDEFLDLDLSILGAPKIQFQAYEDQIRKEYSMVPDTIYLPKRKEVMASMKGEYFTGDAKRLWQAQRDKNLSDY